MEKILVAIPCLNEEKTISGVIGKIPKVVLGMVVDVLVIDDGSVDQTGVLGEAAGAKVVKHMGNKGVGTAFQTAVEYAIHSEYSYMVNIDGDGQFDPLDIEKIIHPLFAGEAEMTTASRFLDNQLIPVMPKVKLYGNFMMSALVSRLCGKRFYDVSCGFRGYTREALLRLNLHGAFTYTQESFLDLVSKRLQIIEVPIRVIYFSERRSRVAGSIVKYALNTSAIIFRIYRDHNPLRFFFGLAGLSLVPALLFGSQFFYHFIMTGKFSGYLYAGFTFGFFLVLSLIFSITAIVADMLDRVRMNQERILYILKKNVGV